MLIQEVVSTDFWEGAELVQVHDPVTGTAQVEVTKMGSTFILG